MPAMTNPKLFVKSYSFDENIHAQTSIYTLIV